jgi:hypothetical protein
MGVAHGALDAARLPFRHLDVIPGQGIEPRPPRSERGVLPVRRSRIVPFRPPPSGGDRRKGTSFAVPDTRAEPPMSMPLAYPSTLDRRPRAYTSAGRRHRGGALEPEPRASARKAYAKADANANALFQALDAEGSFSLRRGLDSI